MPTGQVSRLHTRIITQPMDTRGRGGKSELLRTEHRGDGDIAAAHQLAVGLQAHPAAQSVQNQVSGGLPPAPAPKEDRRCEWTGPRRRAGSAVTAGDENYLSAGLGDAGGDGADTGLADQLDADTGAAVGVFQIIDQLRKIFDGVDIMMGRRRDQADAGSRVAGLGDPGIDLGPRADGRPRRAWRPEPS